MLSKQTKSMFKCLVASISLTRLVAGSLRRTSHHSMDTHKLSIEDEKSKYSLFPINSILNRCHKNHFHFPTLILMFHTFKVKRQAHSSCYIKAKKQLKQSKRKQQKFIIQSLRPPTIICNLGLPYAVALKLLAQLFHFTNRSFSTKAQ